MSEIGDQLKTECSIKNNRRKTKGRRYIFIGERKISTPSARELHLDTIEMNAPRPPRGVSERTLAKKMQSNRAVLIWDSSRRGTFRGCVRDQLM